MTNWAHDADSLAGLPRGIGEIVSRVQICPLLYISLDVSWDGQHVMLNVFLDQGISFMNGFIT